MTTYPTSIWSRTPACGRHHGPSWAQSLQYAAHGSNSGASLSPRTCETCMCMAGNAFSIR